MSELGRIASHASVLVVALASVSGCDDSPPPICSGSPFECPQESAQWPMRTTAPPVYRSDKDTVTDGVTGLMWQRKAPEDMFRWTKAQSYCEELSLGGHSDWRLPSRLELVTLVEYERVASATDPESVPANLRGQLGTAAAAAIDTAAFPDTSPAEFWSTSHFSGSDGDVAWTVDFRTGELFAQPLELMVPRARCVRSARQASSNGATGARFSIGTNTATERATGLVWQRELGSLPSSGGSDSSSRKTIEDAQTYCAELTLDGMTGFRLPHVKELLTLAAGTVEGLAMDPAVFKAPKYYWSGSVLTSTRAGSLSVRGAMTPAYFAVDFKEGGRITSRVLTDIRCVRDKAGPASPAGPPDSPLPPDSQP